jgi:hypothetical protein
VITGDAAADRGTVTHANPTAAANRIDVDVWLSARRLGRRRRDDPGESGPIMVSLCPHPLGAGPSEHAADAGFTLPRGRDPRDGHGERRSGRVTIDDHPATPGPNSWLKVRAAYMTTLATWNRTRRSRPTSQCDRIAPMQSLRRVWSLISLGIWSASTSSFRPRVRLLNWDEPPSSPESSFIRQSWTTPSPRCPLCGTPNKRRDRRAPRLQALLKSTLLACPPGEGSSSS